MVRVGAGSPEATELRELLGRLAAIDRDLYARSREHDELVTQIDTRRFYATARRRGRATGCGRRATGADTAACTTAACARAGRVERRPRAHDAVVGRRRAARGVCPHLHRWSRGRASEMAVARRCSSAFTGISTTIAIAVRKRLPATAEAFTALTIALAMIDWLALRRAGVASAMSTEAWWAIGSAVIGLLSLALGEITARDTGRRAAAILFPTSLALVISIVAAAPWSAGLGLALLATAIALVYGQVHDDELLSVILAIEGIAAWTFAALAAAVAATQPDTLAAAFVPALVVLALGTAPLSMRRRELALAVVPGAILTLGARCSNGSGWWCSRRVSRPW